MSTTTQIALLSPAVGTANIGDHFIEMAIRRLLCEKVNYHRFSIRRPLNAAEIRQINQMSCAVLCGTNLYQHDWESALTPAVLGQIRVPVVPFGVGSSAARMEDTHVSDTTRAMMRAIHQRCVVGSVRDPHAREVAARLGIENIIMTGCPVLFWAGQEGLPRVEPRPARRLVLTARNWLMHRWPDSIDHPVQIELLQRILERFAARPFTFAVHEDFDRRLVEKLKIPPDAVLDSSDPLDYVRLYSDPDNAVLAMRLHAGMLARGNGLPVVFVGHDTRTYAFCDMLGIECINLFAEDCVARCIDRIEHILAGEPGPADRADQVFEQLRGEMNRFLTANHLPPRSGTLT